MRIAALAAGELDFPGARTIALATRQRENKKTGKSSTETVAYISNLLSPSCQQLSGIIRNHWTIENSFFHVRDATMLEDRHPMHTGDGPLNFALLRSFAISVRNLTQAKSFPEAAHRFRQFAHSFLAHFQVDPLALAA